MTSVSETTCTLRYELRSREIYIEEPITSPETLSEHPQTQDESINTIQEMANSQFRLVLSVTPCVPRISSLESVNDNTSPLLFSPTSSLTYVPTPDSPKEQPPPSPTSSTSSLTSFHSCKHYIAPSTIKPYHLNYSAPPPHLKTCGHHLPPYLNNPHELEEGIIYAIIQALRPQIGARRNKVELLGPPSWTP